MLLPAARTWPRTRLTVLPPQHPERGFACAPVLRAARQGRPVSRGDTVPDAPHAVARFCLPLHELRQVRPGRAMSAALTSVAFSPRVAVLCDRVLNECPPSADLMQVHSAMRLGAAVETLSRMSPSRSACAHCSLRAAAARAPGRICWPRPARCSCCRRCASVSWARRALVEPRLMPACSGTAAAAGPLRIAEAAKAPPAGACA